MRDFYRPSSRVVLDSDDTTTRSRHQTEIVSEAHPGAGARIAIPAPSSSIDASQKEIKYSYIAFQAG